MPAPLFEPGWLQDKTLAICDGFVNGKVKLKEGKSLTPTVIAKLIQEKSGGKLAEPPSSGAVAAIFDRWAEYGIAKFSTKPRAFVGWTKGKPDLAAIRVARSEARKAKRAAEAPAKPAKAPAKKAPAKKAPAKKAAKKAAAKA